MKLWTIEGNRLRLDGGAMFGNVPRALWEGWFPADDRHRIGLACRSLLLQAGSRCILFEAGAGLCFPPALLERYGIEGEDHRLLSGLSTLGIPPEKITDVVLSHLHFDHAGGLLAPVTEGEAPRLLFSSARYHVSRRALERAKTPHLRDRASFLPGLPELIEASGRLELIDDPRQHSLAPTVRFRFSEGHSPGLMQAEIRGARRKVLVAADLVPGLAWMHLPVTMGYDRSPELAVDEKRRLLEESLEQGTYLFFTHDPAVALAKVIRDEKGRFASGERMERLEGWEL